MNKKGLGLGSFVLLFMGIIVVLAMFSPILDTTSLLKDLQPITDETTNLQTSCLDGIGHVNTSNSNCNITLEQWTAYASDWRTTESQCYPSSVVVTNSTGTALTVNTDYKVYDSVGVVQMLNTTATSNTTNGNSVLIDYNYCDEGYNKDASSRGIVTLIIILSALALLAFVLDKSGVVDFSNMSFR